MGGARGTTDFTSTRDAAENVATVDDDGVKDGGGHAAPAPRNVVHNSELRSISHCILMMTCARV